MCVSFSVVGVSQNKEISDDKMGRVKIRHLTPTNRTKQKLLQVLSQNLIYATKIIDATDGFIVLTRNDQDLDLIFQGECLNNLQEENFSPILPPEIRAKRTVLIFRVDEYIYEHSEKEIIEELEQKNTWITDGIDNLYKFPKNNIIKIQFKQTAAAKKATDIGQLGFHMSISSQNIKIEEYINITTC